MSSCLISGIIYVQTSSRLSSVPSIKYGLEHEAEAVQKYIEQKQLEGSCVAVYECGLFVDIENGELAASPDRLVKDNLCAEDPYGLVEVKCLYSCRDISPAQAVQTNAGKQSFP